MAIRKFNSVGGFSVGETPVDVVYANGDITTGNANLVGNLYIANTSSHGILTDNIYHTNGTPWDFLKASGASNYIQFSNGTDLDSSANFQFEKSSSNLTVTGNVTITAQTLIGNLTSNITVLGGNIDATGHVDAKGYVYANDDLIVGSTTGEGGQVVFGFVGVNNITGQTDGTWNLDVDSSNNFRLFAQYNGSVPGIVLTANVDNGDVEFGANIYTDGSGSFSTIYDRNLQHNGYIVFTDGDGQLVEDSTLTYLNGVLSASNANITTDLYIGGLGANVDITNGNISGTGLLTIANITANNDANIGNQLFVGNSLANVTIANGNVTTTGNITVGPSGSNVVIDNTGNITATGTIAANTITYTGNVQAPGSDTQVVFNDAGNVNASSGFTFAKLSNTLTVSGNIVTSGGTGGDITMTGGNITGANNVSANSLTLTNDATIGGNLYVAGSTTYVNTTTMAVEDPIIQLGGGANNATLSSNDNIDRGLLMHYYTTQPVDAFMGWDNSGSQFIVASDVTYTSSGQAISVNTYGNLIAGNANLGNLTTSNYFHGVFDNTSSSQPNIHSVGTLQGLTANSTVDFTTASDVSLGDIGNLHITGTTTYGQILASDGAGSVYWTSSPNVNEIENGNSNISIPNAGDNIHMSVYGTSDVVVVYSTGANVTGTLNVTGDTSIGNSVSGNLNIGSTTIQAVKYTSTSAAPGQTIVTVDVNNTDIRGIEFFIKGEDTSANKYKIATVSAVHDSNGNVEYTETTVATSNGSPGTLSVTISGTVISLKVDPAMGSTNTVWTTQYRTI